MARYYFRLNECGELSDDDEGREIPTEKLAKVAANEARAIMSSEVLNGRLCLGCKIEVLDVDHQLVLTVPFRDAVEISGLVTAATG